MAKYTVPLVGYANIAVDVETDETDPEKIAELAMEQSRPSLCRRCADSRNDSLMLGDEWDPVLLENGKPEVTRISD